MIKQALRLTDLDSIHADSSVSFQNEKSAAALIKSAIKNGEVDASIIIEQWFSKVKADVFISHSGADHRKISALANRLKADGYTPFVDSLFWGNIYTLIDEEFNKIRETKNTVDYSDVRKVCANYYMILSLQLARMVESTPVFLFVDTHNSRDSKIPGNTTSPWIYLELETAKRAIYPLTAITESATAYAAVSFPTDVSWMTAIKSIAISTKLPPK